MTQEQLIRQSLSVLAHFGVREVCIAAGARNAPLVAALLTSTGVLSGQSFLAWARN